MDVENSIVSGSSCDPDQNRVMHSMALLTRQDIAHAVSGGSSNTSHLIVADRVLAQRYTYFGYKDYMYCYINSAPGALDYIIDNICEYCISLSLSDYNKLLMFMKLLYSPVLLATTDGIRYTWKYFNGRTWVNVDKHQIRNMMRSRMITSAVTGRLNISPDESEYVQNRLYNHIQHDDVTSMFYSCEFDSKRDNKDSVFCMKTCSYDMVSRSIRISLPSDLCTLAGEVDPSASQHSTKLQAMMAVLSSWMGAPDVADSYLDILAGALSEFSPRYAVVNVGTGADGKSTFFHVVNKLFGTYCMTMPTTGPRIDSKGANEATPATAAMAGRRVCITTDASDVDKLLSSSGFKSISGGDRAYVRRLFKEADTEGQRLKMLILVATNQSDFVVASIHELTRIRVARWTSKRVSVEDRDIIPKHQIARSGEVINRYEDVFISEYGPCMMMELISRHASLADNNMRIILCKTMREWTRDTVSPKTILKFLSDCTEASNPDMVPEDESTRLALAATSSDANVSVESLFLSYMIWRKNGARFSKSDPVTMQQFKVHLEFYHRISSRINSRGEEELYVQGLSLKYSTNDIFSVMSGNNNMSALTFIKSNPMIYTDGNIYNPGI